jgi:hypothetical protein
VYTWDHKSSAAFWAGMKVLVLFLSRIEVSRSAVLSDATNSESTGDIDDAIWMFWMQRLTLLLLLGNQF